MQTKRLLLIVVLFSFLFSAIPQAATVMESINYISNSKDFVEVKPAVGLAINLKYATVDNFVGQNLYKEFNKAYLHIVAAEKLAKAVVLLQAIKPQYKLVIFDALRPRSVQFLLWNNVKGTSRQGYVANPRTGSIHNFGMAVDLSLLNADGVELDMGTKFDDFTELSQPQFEEKFIKAGRLSKEQVENRLLLRKVMVEAGFIQLPLEWWHFDALPKAEVKSTYKIVE